MESRFTFSSSTQSTHWRCVVDQNSRPHSKHILGGAVVVVAVIGETEILLIRETTKPKPHYWKLISETAEPDEPILNTLWGGVREEAGFEMKAERDEKGKVVKIVDPHVKAIKELAPPEWVSSGRAPHWRHFWGILTTDHVVTRLSGKHHSGDENEEIDTHAFPLAGLHTLPDLLRQHVEMIRNIPQHASA